jgi:hypothetical protein
VFLVEVCSAPESGRPAEVVIALINAADRNFESDAAMSAMKEQQHGTAGRRPIDRTREMGREPHLDTHTNRCPLFGPAIRCANKA